MSSQGIPKVSDLPLIQDFIPGDKIIISREGQEYLIDYDNIYIQNNQISFNQDIINDTNNVSNLQQYSTDKLDELVVELNEKSISRSTSHLIDLTNVTTEGTLSSSSYREFITSTNNPFIGPNNLVVFDTAIVDKLNLSIDGATDTENVECDVDRIVYGNGTISIPKGTYRIRASISLSPEVNLDLNQDTLDEYIRRKQQVWSYLSFVQLTNPERTILNGTGSSTYNNIGQSITLTLNGYFYTDATRQYGLKVHTLGKLYPGVVTGTYSQDNNSDTVDTKYLSISELFGRSQYNQSRILIERISDTDTLSPLEDSPQGFRSQSLELQPRVPLVYNSGWIQKINAQDTSVVPASSLLVITTLPYTKVGDKYVGDARGYVTEPKSYQGYIKIGDTVRYRSQQLDSQGILPVIYNKYDVRDSSLQKLSPGWYGLIVDETIKEIGQVYDTVFRVDKHGVVSQRVYLVDPENYYLRCIAGNTPPAVSATPPPLSSTGTITSPPVVVPKGQVSASQSSVTQIVPAGVSFIHAVCIGGGQGGYRSSLKNLKYNSGSAGNGGNTSYKNNIPVTPGDTLILIPGKGGRGTGYNTRNEERRKGDNSELFLRKTTGERILILRAAGGGRSTAPVSGSITGRGGRGARNKYKAGGGQSNRQLEEYLGGGGGAGGYGKSGGNGGRDTRGKTGSGGGGGGGGAGIGRTKKSGARGGRGGGVGSSGKGINGRGGRFGNPAGENGDAGSNGVNQNFGGGGRSVYYDNADNDLMDGGRGVVRVIWGTGRSFPNNAR